LLGFLEQFSESIKQEEGYDAAIDDEASITTIASPSPASPHMVGPTTTELESINELIRFDHVYVKSEQQKTPTAIQVMTKPAAATAAVANTRQMVSVLRPIQPKTAITSCNIATVKEEKEEDTVVKSASDAPLNLLLGDSDLEALSESILGQVDFETMLKELDPTHDDLAATPIDLSASSRSISSANSQNSLKRKSPDTLEFEAKKVKSDDLKINLTVEGSFAPVLTTPDPAETGYMFEFDSSLGNSSGYLSDEVSSPKSDDSGLLDWEDQSFSELFPSLL
jgi:hypothetical protein